MPAWLAPRSMDATPPPVPTATGCLVAGAEAGACPAALSWAGTATSNAANADKDETVIQRRRRRIGDLFCSNMSRPYWSTAV